MEVAPRDRGKLMLKIAEDVEAITEDLARTIAAETGNALRTQARPEAALASDIFRYFGGLASEAKGETIPLGENVLSYSRREPIGVVGAIIPWNVPLMLLGMKLGPALLAGNCVVVKTSEEAPFAALEVCRLMNEILPPGVLNVVSGLGAEAGDPLVRDRRVARSPSPVRSRPVRRSPPPRPPS